METPLSGNHRRTYDAIFQHPLTHNLDWADVRSLFAAVSEVSLQQKGNLKVTRNGTTVTFRPSQNKQVSAPDELMQIRHFLQRSAAATNEGVDASRHLLVVIDHRSARVYRTELYGAAADVVTPYDPDGRGRHLHYVENESNGQRKPESVSFYNAVAKSLEGAGQILLFGHGTGASSAVEHLMSELNLHHAELASHVIGCHVVDEPHLTEGQLLAKARQYFRVVTTA
jgi:hypothetical protein